jgi:hypothetical protein
MSFFHLSAPFQEVQPQHLAPAEVSERADVASHDSGDEGGDEEDPEGSASEGD